MSCYDPYYDPYNYASQANQWDKRCHNSYCGHKLITVVISSEQGATLENAQNQTVNLKL